MMPVDGSAAGGSLAALGAAWLLSFTVHSTLLLGGVWLVTRRPGLPVSWSETLWKAAMLGGILSATWQSFGIGGAPLGGRFVLSALAGGGSAAVPGGGILSGPDSLHPASWWSGIGFAPVLLGLWIVGAAIGVARLALARRRLARLLGPRREVREGPAADALARLARAAGFRRPVRLTVSSGIAGPMALEASEICIPERALLGLTPEQQESALAHELAHLARRDPGWNWLSAILGHVFFFQPLFRLARRRIRESAEYLSDDWAVRQTGRGVVLARCLVEVAGWRGARPAAAFGASMADHPSSSLSRRIERLVGGPRREPGRPLRLAGAVVLLLAVTALAPGVAPRPRTPVPQFDPVWAVFSDASAALPPEGPQGAVLPPRLGDGGSFVPSAPSPPDAAIPPAETPELGVVPTPPGVPAPPGSPEEGSGSPAGGDRRPHLRLRAPITVVVLVSRSTALASVARPARRVLRDEVVAPAPRAVVEEARILRSQADLERSELDGLVLSEEALRRAMAWDRQNMAAVQHVLERARRNGQSVEALQLLLEASQAELRARLDALRAAAALSDRI